MSLIPTLEDQAFGAGYHQASEAGGMVIDHLGKRLREVEAERDELKSQLGRALKLLKQNTGLLCESGNLNNYRNLNDQELGKAWVETAKRTAAFLNEVEGVPRVSLQVLGDGQP